MRCYKCNKVLGYGFYGNNYNEPLCSDCMMSKSNLRAQLGKVSKPLSRGMDDLREGDIITDKHGRFRKIFYVGDNNSYAVMCGSVSLDELDSQKAEDYILAYTIKQLKELADLGWTLYTEEPKEEESVDPLATVPNYIIKPLEFVNRGGGRMGLNIQEKVEEIIEVLNKLTTKRIL